MSERDETEEEPQAGWGTWALIIAISVLFVVWVVVLFFIVPVVG